MTSHVRKSNSNFYNIAFTIMFKITGKRQWLLMTMTSILFFECIVIINNTRHIGQLQFATFISSSWEVTTLLGLESKVSSVNLPPRCTIPLNSSTWNHFDALVDENVALTSRVRRLLSPRNDSHADNETIIGEEVGEGIDENRIIPHLLIFTHKDDIFNCSVSASNLTMSPNLHTLAENAKATVRAYHRVWPDVQYVFLSDEDCIDSLNRTEPELIPFFNDANLEGKYKADLCRAAYLVLHGGYYFDVDLLVVKPYVAPTNTTLVTVLSNGDKDFFQAFIAAEKGNPILLRSLRIMLEMLRKDRITRGYLGPTSLIDASMEVLNVTDVSSVINGENDGLHLLTECHLADTNPSSKCKELIGAVVPKELGSEFMQRTPSGYGLKCQDPQWNWCNYVVLDDSSSIGGQQLYFYSRVVGTTYCGKACTE